MASRQAASQPDGTSTASSSWRAVSTPSRNQARAARRPSRRTYRIVAWVMRVFRLQVVGWEDDEALVMTSAMLLMGCSGVELLAPQPGAVFASTSSALEAATVRRAR